MPCSNVSLCRWPALAKRCDSLPVKQKQSNKCLTMEGHRNAEGQRICKREYPLFSGPFIFYDGFAHVSCHMGLWGSTTLSAKPLCIPRGQIVILLEGDSRLVFSPSCWFSFSVNNTEIWPKGEEGFLFCLFVIPNVFASLLWVLLRDNQTCNFSVSLKAT